MSLAATWVRLDTSTPASELAPHSPPTWETLAEGGSGEASFELGSSAKFAPHLTRPDTRMEIFVGSVRVWNGRIADFDRQTGQVIGRGLHADGLYIPALDGSGNLTHDLATAFTTANADPWKWPVHRMNLTGTMTGDSTAPVMIWAMIEALAEQVGCTPYVDPDGVLYIAEPPTEPTWIIAPDAAVFGSTTEGQATTLVGRYDTGSGFATTIRSDPIAQTARAEVVDLTERGVLTLAQANAILDAAIVGTTQTGWVNGITLNREQITRNGTPAFLPAVHARSRMVRVHGQAVAFGPEQATSLDAVLAKTRYTAGEDVIYLEPAKTAPRNFVSVLAAS